MKPIYIVFCDTDIGNCIVVVESDSTVEAEAAAKKWLLGEDIESVNVDAVEEIDLSNPCVIWDDELKEAGR